MWARRVLRTKGGGGLGLEIRFALVVGCVVSIMAAIAGASLFATERDVRVGHFVQASAAKAGIVVAQHADSLLGGQADQREAALGLLSQEPWIRRVEVYDAAAALIAARAQDGESAVPATRDVQAAIARAAPISRSGDSAVSVATPVMRSGRAVGAVRLVMGQSSLPPPPPSALTGLLIAYGAALLIGVPMAIFMAQRITRPLQQLTDFSKELSAHVHAEPITMRTGDEFETLAGAYNAMIARFNDSLRRIERLAFRDAPTDLPNLAGAHKIITEKVQDALAAREAGVVFVLRVERLDAMVEMIGNDRAQDLVGMIAARLRQRLKSIDQNIRTAISADKPSVLARLTGADFCVITPSFATGADAAKFAQRLAAALSQPLEWREQTFSFGGRVGAAVFPRDGQDPDTLIRLAFLAVSAANTEQGRAVFFAKEMERAAARRIVAEREIRAGIDQRAFVAHFQPKIDLASRRVVGAEALARWIQPNGVVIGPSRFIGVAEEFGLIGPIAEAILADSCWKAASWAREGDPVRVAVNVSPLQLVDERFTERVKRVLLETGLAANLLELEITESVAMTNPERAGRLLSPLKDIGVTIALDDFGCGHSSLSALSKLPFDVVKIDQSFVRALHHDPHAAAIIDTIITLAGRLGCKVVAEGVENESEAQYLLSQGCRVAQGFLFGPAMAPLEFRRLQQSMGPAPLAGDGVLRAPSAPSRVA